MHRILQLQGAMGLHKLVEFRMEAGAMVVAVVMEKAEEGIHNGVGAVGIEKEVVVGMEKAAVGIHSGKLVAMAKAVVGIHIGTGEVAMEKVGVGIHGGVVEMVME